MRQSTIRRRTLWFSVAVFAVTWTVIFAQLVAGRDPALARKQARAAAVAEQRKAPHAHYARPRQRRHARRHHPRRRSHPVQATSTPAAPAATPTPPVAPAPVVTSQS